MKPFKPSIAAFLLLLVSAISAHALEREPYTQERFEALQAAGEVVLVDIHADWCSTCAKQQTALEKYRAENPEKTFHILKVDFDQQKDLVRQFRAPRQSTFLLYKGNDQFWYSVAETRYEVIAAEIDKALLFKGKK